MWLTAFLLLLVLPATGAADELLPHPLQLVDRTGSFVWLGEVSFTEPTSCQARARSEGDAFESGFRAYADEALRDNMWVGGGTAAYSVYHSETDAGYWAGGSHAPLTPWRTTFWPPPGFARSYPVDFPAGSSFLWFDVHHFQDHRERTLHSRFWLECEASTMTLVDEKWGTYERYRFSAFSGGYGAHAADHTWEVYATTNQTLTVTPSGDAEVLFAATARPMTGIVRAGYADPSGYREEVIGDEPDRMESAQFIERYRGPVTATASVEGHCIRCQVAVTVHEFPHGMIPGWGE